MQLTQLNEILHAMRRASLTIRNIPAPVLARLRSRAAANRRSMQGEVLAILEGAAAEGPVLSARGALERIRSLKLSTPSESVAMLRADRDGR